ncbi:hypothetical protein SEUCBS139899_004860 [Sporothrix eucalyptigena]|uniref:Uncharacterized protein n=1 Tax=Sporothrix eucalyptigena TaxID=1812306 RepID=A0ABP0BI23_9PEZI
MSSLHETTSTLGKVMTQNSTNDEGPDTRRASNGSMVCNMVSGAHLHVERCSSKGNPKKSVISLVEEGNSQGLQAFENYFGCPSGNGTLATHGDDSILVDAYDSDDESAFSHVSDEELTMESEITDLRSARTNLWEHDIDSGLAVRKVHKAPTPTVDRKATTTIKGMLPTATSVASTASAASAAASTKAKKATKAAKTMARSALASTTTNVGKTEILHRFINGSARAPGQVLTWMSSLSGDKMMPSGRSVSSVYTLPTPRSSGPPSLVSTPPTSRGSSPNASATALASTSDENTDPAEYDAMSAGTLFEPGPFGHLVPIVADGDDNQDQFEIVYHGKENNTPTGNVPGEENVDGFCVLAPMSNNTN